MSIETIQVRLNMIQMQLNWLEREIAALRQDITRSTPTAGSPRTFADLRGLWTGVIFDEQDLKASRLKLPEGL